MESASGLEPSCSSPTKKPSSLPTLFRVRRKRHAEPHEALVISLKRARHDDKSAKPIICQLADISSFQNANIIDVEPTYDDDNQAMIVDSVKEEVQNEDENENPLGVFLYTANEDSENKPDASEVKVVASNITLNGVPLQIVNSSNHVFDYYWNGSTFDYTAEQIEKARLSNSDYLDLFEDNDADSSLDADDDDDSNDENNWRNDYPDELENTSTSDDDSEEMVDGYDDIQRGFDEFGLDA